MKNLSFQVFAAVVVAPALLALIVAGAVLPESGEIRPQQLVYLGRVGNKTYFLESVSMAWSQASTYCKTANMDLATIDNAAEYAFLVGAIQERISTETVWAWTDGIEQTQTTTFVWNSTQTHAMNVTTTVDAPISCLLLEVEKTQAQVMAYGCRGTVSTLCQAVN